MGTAKPFLKQGEYSFPMPVYCSCGVFLGIKQALEPGRISHGLCEKCVSAYRLQLKAMHIARQQVAISAAA